MIQLLYTCDHATCATTAQVSVLADRLFHKWSVKMFTPSHWTVRMPRGGYAVTYCPEHQGREADHDHRAVPDSPHR